MQDSSSDHHDAAPQHAAMYDGGGGGGGSVHGSDAGYGGGDSVHGRWHEDGSVHGYGGGSVLGSVTGGGSKHKHGFGASFGALSRSPSMASSYTGSESEFRAGWGGGVHSREEGFRCDCKVRGRAEFASHCMFQNLQSHEIVSVDHILPAFSR